MLRACVMWWLSARFMKEMTSASKIIAAWWLLQHVESLVRCASKGLLQLCNTNCKTPEVFALQFACSCLTTQTNRRGYLSEQKSMPYLSEEPHCPYLLSVELNFAKNFWIGAESVQTFCTLLRMCQGTSNLGPDSFHDAVTGVKLLPYENAVFLLHGRKLLRL